MAVMKFIVKVLLFEQARKLFFNISFRSRIVRLLVFFELWMRLFPMKGDLDAIVAALQPRGCIP